jgi:hypothetical protein
MYINELFLESDAGFRLKDLCSVQVNQEDSDFWLQRNGSEKTIGQVTKEFNKDNIGVKVIRTDIVLPAYLYYAMQHVFNTGHWAQFANGSLRLQHLRVSDVANLRIG